MGDFKLFALPEKPFLLIYETEEDGINVAWFHTEEDLMECVDEVKSYGCQSINAIKIGSYRDIDIEE